ncbi:MAG: hypothetical protein ACTHK4_10315 [Mycobacteriales bacterium]
MDHPVLVLRDSARWLLGILLVGWFGIGIAVLIYSYNHRPSTSTATGFLFFVPVQLFGLSTIQMWRPVRLTRDQLDVPRFLHDYPVPVSEIAGVGLCYLSEGRASGWRTAIWTTHGAPVFIINHMTTGGNIEKSHAARQAKALWQAICEIQGPTGPLSTEARQHGEASRWAMITRVWCPDDDSLYKPREVAKSVDQASGA